MQLIIFFVILLVVIYDVSVFFQLFFGSKIYPVDNIHEGKALIPFNYIFYKKKVVVQPTKKKVTKKKVTTKKNVKSEE